MDAYYDLSLMNNPIGCMFLCMYVAISDLHKY